MDDRTECDEICKTLPVESSIVIREDDVATSLSKLKPNKTTGPDGLKARLLKDCAPQLKGVQSLTDTYKVPKLWKFSIIRPVPKKPGVNTPNGIRPVAITSILCKTVERVLASHLTTTVATMLDPLQFAYKRHR